MLIFFLQVYFECNGAGAEDSQLQQHQQHFVDPMTGTRTVEAAANVTRDQVEEYFGHAAFQCKCVAWSSRGTVRSRPAVVEVACKYLTFLDYFVLI
jgi:leucine-rich repeat transmembrane protein FLRT